MTVTSTPPDSLSLATAMREGSMAEHQAAENSTYMSELLEGRLNHQGYADYLLRLRVVYAALEDAVRTHAADPLVAAVADPALERLAQIDADLDHWLPGAGREIDSPAAEAYRERIEQAAAQAAAGWGGALVAHHYTRYLGDLSGGQAIGRILDRTFTLDGAGIAFYGFAEIAKPKPYKDGYRARLDAAGLDEAEISRVVDEVRAVFQLNQGLFVELGEHLPAYRR